MSETANDNKSAVQEALKYLKTGGMGEVVGLTEIAMQMSQPKVQMDTDMACALCILASQALAKDKSP